MPPNTQQNRGYQPPKHTRAQAERLIAQGHDPKEFTTHPNYHVRRKAWEKMGRPLPQDPTEAGKLLADLRVR